MSVGPIFGPASRPSNDRDHAELFKRIDDLERVRPPVSDQITIGARVTAASGGTGPAVGFSTTLEFDTTEYDTDSMFDIGSPTRLTVKTAGVFLFTAAAKITAVSGKQMIFQLGWQVNGAALTDLDQQQTLGATNQDTKGSADIVLSLDVGDYVEAVITNLPSPQGSTPSLTIEDCSFTATRFADMGSILDGIGLPAHHASHEDGGNDEIDLTDLDGTPTELANHLADTSDAHDASAISVADSGGYFSSGDVEGALQELGAAGGGGGGGGIGATELIYRYTVTGSDKASIDTGSDTPDAGSNDWSNGDLLEVFFYSRTDEAALSSGFVMNLNNDSNGNYDRAFVRDLNATVSGGNTRGDTNQDFTTAGASEASGVFGLLQFVVPNYAGTVGNKVATGLMVQPSQTASDITILITGQGYRSTSALSRIAFAPLTSGKKFKVGTQLLIYKRLAS